MSNFFSVLLTTLKNSIVSIWTKVRYWLSPNFWRSKVLTGLRRFLQKIFNVKPKDKNDYFTIRNWMISRRLCFAVVIVLGLASLYVLLTFASPFGLLQGASAGARVYRYNSVPLRFAEGNVKIKARSGYIAYEGNVKGGYATGSGNLYNKDAELIYSGNFEHNQYNGEGTLFYPTGQTHYTGAFVDNCFEGTGILYRTDGSIEYEGQFLADQKEGQGILYDSGDNAVFNGAFHCDRLVYNQFLGKKTSEIGKLYTGDSRIYSDDSAYLVYMEDIQALYGIDQRESSIEDEAIVSRIYVLDSAFLYGQNTINNMEAVQEVLGKPEFEGNTYATLPEAVAVELLRRQDDRITKDPELITTAVYDEVISVESYRTDLEIYLYVYQVEDLTYTFFCQERGGPFFMYLIEQ